MFPAALTSVIKEKRVRSTVRQMNNQSARPITAVNETDGIPFRISIFTGANSDRIFRVSFTGSRCDCLEVHTCPEKLRITEKCNAVLRKHGSRASSSKMREDYLTVSKPINFNPDGTREIT